MIPRLSRLRGLAVLAAAAVLAALISTPAAAQGTGYAGDGAFVGSSTQAEVPPLPVENTAPEPAARQGGLLVPVNEPPPLGAPAPQAMQQQAQPPAEAAADPCAAYAASRNGYEACKDRMMKIQRMRDASTQRAEDLKAYYTRIKGRTAPVVPENAPAAPAQEIMPASAQEAGTQ